MKTLVRIQERTDENNGYGVMTVQILVKPCKDSDSIDVIGHISFQRTLSEDGPKRWYAMKFNVETDQVEHLQKMANLAKYIKKNRDNWDSQPDEILKIIGAVEYVVFDNEFIPKSKDGENIYDVFSKNGELYTKIIAKDDFQAIQKLKRKKIDGATLTFKKKIVL